MAVGYFVMASAVILYVVAPIFAGLGYAGRNFYKRLVRVYSLQVVWYWLRRLEAEGKACFEKAADKDDAK